MALPLHRRALPQCAACVRSYAWASLTEITAPVHSGLRQQVRGKKKMPNRSATVTVRLIKDVATFGKKGALVPVERGRMRNQFFPQGIAEYVTVPEMKTIRLSGAPIERDPTFGVEEDARMSEGARRLDEFASFGNVTDASRTANQTLRLQRVTPERSVELFEIFVRSHLDFYRQPTPEEKDEDEEPMAEEEKTRSASSAATDLLAARAYAIRRARAAKPRAIYGSVSTNDVLVAIRAAMATNDEAARVTLADNDIEFVNLPTQGDNEPGRLKNLGDFSVEIRIKGADQAVRRTVRVLPQEA